MTILDDTKLEVRDAFGLARRKTRRELGLVRRLPAGNQQDNFSYKAWASNYLAISQM